MLASKVDSLLDVRVPRGLDDITRILLQAADVRLDQLRLERCAAEVDGRVDVAQGVLREERLIARLDDGRLARCAVEGLGVASLAAGVRCRQHASEAGVERMKGCLGRPFWVTRNLFS